MFQRNKNSESKKQDTIQKKSTLIESKAIRDFLKHCTYNTTVILDLDNTIIEPTPETEGVCSDQGFVQLLSYASGLSLQPKEATDAVITIYNALHKHVKMQAVESRIVGIINGLQDIGIDVYALTSRNFQIIKETETQLESIDIDFSKPNKKQTFKLDIEKENSHVIYSKGIIYCNGNDKGRCLESFFKKQKLNPHNIVMIDDKEKYLHSVSTAIKSNFVGIRYGFLDEKAKKMDLDKTKKQINTVFDELNQEAQEAVLKLKIR